MTKAFLQEKEIKNRKGEKEKQYTCLYCNTPYSEKKKAEKCIKDHDIIYFPISRDDLNRLNNFIFTREDKLLSSSLIETIRKYARNLTRSR